MNQCKLCQQERKLCRSHIIPEWAYRPLYDQSGSALALSSEEKRQQKVQTGLWDRLFCVDCDQYLNHELDQPFHRFWTASDRFPPIINRSYVTIGGIAYEATKRFLLSILWRAHVASKPVVSAVDLGPHADRIRSILLTPHDKDLGDGYPIFCYALRDPDTGGLAKQFVLTPVRKRTKGQWNYEVAFLGCAWKVFVSSSPPPLPESCSLKTDGTIVIPVVSFKEFAAIRHVLKVHTAGGSKA